MRIQIPLWWLSLSINYNLRKLWIASNKIIIEEAIMRSKRKRTLGMTEGQIGILLLLAVLALGSIALLVGIFLWSQVPYNAIPNTPNAVQSKPTTRPNPTSTLITNPISSIPPRDTDMYTISYESSSWFGCSDREYFDQIVKYIVDDDKQAAEQALNAGILYGECTIFFSGEQVYLTDTAIFSGLVKIRRKGETQDFWTYAEAVVSNH